MALSRGEILVNPVVSDDGVSSASVTLESIAGGSVSIGAPSGSIGTPYSFTLPTAAPAANGYYLAFNTDGTTSFSAVTASAGGTSGQIQYNNAGALAGATLQWDQTNNILNFVFDSTNQGQIRFTDDNSSNYAAFESPVNITRNYVASLPALIPGTTDGDADGYVLKITSTSNTLQSAVLEWGPALTGANTSQGPTGTVQLSDNTGGFLASPTYDTGNYLNYNPSTGDLNIAVSSGAYQINGADVLTSTALASSVVSSSLTSVGTLTSLTINNTITTPTNTNLLLSPNGAGDVIVTSNGTNPGNIKLQDQQGTPRSLGLTVPASIGTSDYNITLPAGIASPGNMTLQLSNSYAASYVDNRRTVNFLIDGGNSEIQNQDKGVMRFDAAYTVTNWYIIHSFPGGNDTFDVTISKATFAQVQAGTAFSTFSSTLSLSNARAASGTTTGWTSNIINAGDVIKFTVSNHPAAPTGTAIQALVSLTLVPRALT